MSANASWSGRHITNESLAKLFGPAMQSGKKRSASGPPAVPKPGAAPPAAAAAPALRSPAKSDASPTSTPNKDVVYRTGMMINRSNSCFTRASPRLPLRTWYFTGMITHRSKFAFLRGGGEVRTEPRRRWPINLGMGYTLGGPSDWFVTLCNRARDDDSGWKRRHELYLAGPSDSF